VLVLSVVTILPADVVSVDVIPVVPVDAVVPMDVTPVVPVAPVVSVVPVESVVHRRIQDKRTCKNNPIRNHQ